jgi:hypothetical protein
MLITFGPIMSYAKIKVDNKIIFYQIQQQKEPMETIYGNINTIASYLSINDIIHLSSTSRLINNQLHSTLSNLKQSHLSRFANDPQIEELVKCLMESHRVDTTYGEFIVTTWQNNDNVKHFRIQVTMHYVLDPPCEPDPFVNERPFCPIFNYLDLRQFSEINDYIGIDNCKHMHRQCTVRHSAQDHILIFRGIGLGANKEILCEQYKNIITYVKLFTHVIQMIRTSKWNLNLVARYFSSS